VHPPVAPTWAPLTDAGAARARRQVESLSLPTGPVYANVQSADLASYVFQALRRQLPASADSIEAAVIGDRLAMRATVKLSDLGGSGALGPLAGMLGDRERMLLSGTIRIVRPGLGEFDVKELKVRDFSVPRGMLPRLVGRLRRGETADSLSPTGLALKIPPSIGDVRVANGRVTLYRSAR
jgi:hypothetical protein